MENADFDRLVGLCGQCRSEAEGKTRRSGKPAAAPRSFSDRANGFEHRDVLCLDARVRPGAVA